MIGLPFVLSSGQIQVNRALARVTGAVSIVYGFYYMYDQAFNEGLFSSLLQ
ncbi:hypothetical protein [Effusibacillus dendaii]|uniref:hypothetical protein n=1 Tax=Effusibacillus dendaii TaxID=2743772 RepID=UPI00299E39C9|nr:hypothetical protein [Effusibacillus dendaii]